MLNFQLLPGDKYDGRCAEIYITEKQFLIYHCSVCEEIYATFNELLSHITKDHYENTKEYNEMADEGKTMANENTKQENNNDDDDNEENQLKTKEFKSKINFEGNFVIKNSITELTTCVKGEQEILENDEEIREKEDLPTVFEVSKISPQRKKPRMVMGLLKNNAISRTKLNPLTRFQHNNPHEERKYVCGICGFAFKEKYNLRGHILRHSNQKNFSCTQCPKRFFTKVELRLHEYRHKGERPYLCNHCGMGFVSSGSLTQHIKKHHSLNHAFKCEQCDKTFANFYQLKTHQYVHTEERNFPCRECSLAFKCQKTLNNHVKLHENKRKFRCENCDLGFSTEMALSAHQDKHNFQEESSMYKIQIERCYEEENNKEKEEINEEVCVQNNNDAAEWLIEEGLFVLEQNFDEYELVQTLTDLECNKHI